MSAPHVSMPTEGYSATFYCQMNYSLTELASCGQCMPSQRTIQYQVQILSSCNLAWQVRGPSKVHILSLHGEVNLHLQSLGAFYRVVIAVS